MKAIDIKSYFSAHAQAHEFYFTSDGAVFFTDNDAWDHAQKLADRLITKITRAEANGMDDGADKDLASEVVEIPITDFTVAIKTITGEVVKEKFAGNDIAELHFTSDGQAFEDIEFAKQHAEEIEFEKITTITKDAAEKMSDDEVVALEDMPASYVAAEPKVDAVKTEATKAAEPKTVSPKKEAAPKKAAAPKVEAPKKEAAKTATK